MSWLDGIVDDNEALSQIQRLDSTSESPEPGFWQGSFDALGMGLVRGTIEGGRTAESTTLQLGSLDIESSLAISSSYFPEIAEGQVERQQQFRESEAQRIGEETAQASMLLRPDPTATGMAGQIINEAAAILPRTVLGTVVAGPLGGAVAAGAPAGYASKQVGVAEGLDENTAAMKGAIEGVTTGAGALLPAAWFARPAVRDAVIAVGANVGLGVVSRGATAELLESRGYTTQAAQYRAFDGTAIATDAILGAAFFGLGRMSGGRRPTTIEVDAALVERAAQHYDLDTTPGAPTTPKAAVAHQDALRTAIEQVSRGEPVNVPDSVLGVEFLRGPGDIAPVMLARADIEATARADVLPVIRSQLEQEIARAVPNVRDLRTELAGLQRTVDNIDSTFRDRAKEFQQQGSSRKQAEAQARESISQERAQVEQRQQAISEQLDGNRIAEQAKADIKAVDRGEIPDRFSEKVTTRAAEVEQGFQRSPLAQQVAEGGQRFSLRQIAQQEITRLVDEMDRINARPEPTPVVERSARVASPAASDATKPAGGATEPGKPATDSGESVTSAAKEVTPGAAGTDPEVQLAQTVMDELGDIDVPTGAIDADGNPVTVSARQLLADADAEIATAQNESQGFIAAAACFLQRGVK